MSTFTIKNLNTATADELNRINNPKIPKITVTNFEPACGDWTTWGNISPLPTKGGDYRFSDGSRVYHFPKKEWTMFRFKENRALILVPKECATVRNMLPKEDDK